jgi:hypothetical protein
MKKILLFAFLLCSFSAFAQYPAQPTTKQELGRQTTGDGLIYRGSGAPAYTPVNNRNAWIYYDTTNNRLYKSRLGSWSLMIQDTSAFNEIQMPYIVDDTLVPDAERHRRTPDRIREPGLAYCRAFGYRKHHGRKSGRRCLCDRWHSGRLSGFCLLESVFRRRGWGFVQ